MKGLKFNYEAPMVEMLDTEASDIICASADPTSFGFNIPGSLPAENFGN